MTEEKVINSPEEFEQFKVQGTENSYDCTEVTFRCDINLSDRVFREVNFKNAIFEENVDFSYSCFLDDANFAGAKFLGDVGFVDTQFSGRTLFIMTRFKNIVVFAGSKFNYWVDFNNVIFGEHGQFVDTYIEESDRESFRIIKHEFLKNNNRIDALKMHQREMKEYWRALFGENIWKKITYENKFK